MTRKHKADATYAEVMRNAIATRWADTWHELDKVIKSEDPEHIHNTRVASRRLRAAMDVATGAFPRPWYRKLHRKAKSITQALGAVRDADVQIASFRAERATADPSDLEAIDRLIGRMECDRETARQDLDHFLKRLMKGKTRKRTKRRFPLHKHHKGNRA